MVNKHEKYPTCLWPLEKCTTKRLIIRKTTLRFHLTPKQKDILKKQRIANSCSEKGNFLHCNVVQPQGKSVWRLMKARLSI